MTQAEGVSSVRVFILFPGKRRELTSWRLSGVNKLLPCLSLQWISLAVQHGLPVRKRVSESDLSLVKQQGSLEAASVIWGPLKREVVPHHGTLSVSSGQNTFLSSDVAGAIANRLLPVYLCRESQPGPSL